MVSSPINSWQIDGVKVETVTDFIFLDSKITADGDCSHEIKRCLLLGRKAMTNLDSILKSRQYFANKGPSSQSYGFSCSHVWMWELSSKELMLFEIWVLSQFFHSLLSLSRGSLVPLHFLPLEYYHVHIWGCWYFSQKYWLQFAIHPVRSFTWCTLHRS